MGTIWKHPQSTKLFARFKDDTGRYVNRSTGTADPEAARKILEGWEHAVQLAGNGLLTEAKARSVISEILERVSGGTATVAAIRTDAFFESWLVGAAASVKAQTVKHYRATVKEFLAHLGTRKTSPLTTVTPKVLQEFVAERVKAGFASKTIRNNLTILSGAFKRARQERRIDHNPCDLVRLPKVTSLEREVFSGGEVAILIKAAPSADWAMAISAGYFTGLRLSDIVNLRWDSLNLTEGTFSLRQRKTGGKVVAPLHPELLANLEARAGTDSTSPFVMPSLAGRRTSSFSREFTSICLRAGIDTKPQALASGRSLALRSFHSLRHSFESHLANAGVTPEMRRELVGRDCAKTQRIYASSDKFVF